MESDGVTSDFIKNYFEFDVCVHIFAKYFIDHIFKKIIILKEHIWMIFSCVINEFFCNLYIQKYCCLDLIAESMKDRYRSLS